MLLTERQRRVLAEHANGKQLTTIAREMERSYATIRADADRARRSLGASTLAQAVVLALIEGEIGVTSTRTVKPRTKPKLALSSGARADLEFPSP